MNAPPLPCDGESAGVDDGRVSSTSLVPHVIALDGQYADPLVTLGAPMGAMASARWNNSQRGVIAGGHCGRGAEDKCVARTMRRKNARWADHRVLLVDLLDVTRSTASACTCQAYQSPSRIPRGRVH